MPTVELGSCFAEIMGNGGQAFRDAATRTAWKFRSRVAEINTLAGDIAIQGATYRAYTELTTTAGVSVEAVMIPGEPNTVYLRTVEELPAVLAIITFD